MRTVCIMLLGLFYFIFYFWPNQILSAFILILLIVTLIIGLRFISKTAKILSLSMFMIGHVIFFMESGSWEIWSDSMMKNLPLIVLLIFIPLLSLPFKSEGYFSSIEELSRNHLGTKRSFYTGVSFLTFLFCTVLNMGGLRLIHDMLDGYFKRDQRAGVEGLQRGYIATMMWSPYFPTVILILYYLHIQSYVYLIPGLFFAVICFLFSVLYGLIAYRGAKWEKKEISKPDRSHSKKALLFAGCIITLIVAVMCLEKWTGISMTIGISLLSVLFFGLMFFQTKKRRQYLQSFSDYQSVVLPKLVNEVSLFISAGFLGEMVNLTKLGQTLPSFFSASGLVSIWIMIFILIVIFPILSIIGVHPLVTGSILGTSLTPEMLGLSPVILAGSLIAGWAISLMVSPISAINIMIGGMVDVPPHRVSLQWNWRYASLWIVFMTTVFYGYQEIWW